jgi:hypothetical protein
MRVWNVVAFTVAAGTTLPVLLHYQHHGVFSAYQIALAFFLWLNVIIALWEICLFLRIDEIEERHRRLQQAYKGRAIARSLDFLLSRVALRELFSASFWTGIWTSYAGFDESYADKRSFGFFVDVGNGFTTLIPSLVFLSEMTFGRISARALGIVGILLFYQMWYGTLVYLASFILNKRYVGHPPAHLAIIVGCLNGLWLTFPLLGIYASVSMVYTNSYAIFLH